MAKRMVELQASNFEHHDDCLAAAEEHIATREGVDDWQVSAKWTDEERETIEVTITE